MLMSLCSFCLAHTKGAHRKDDDQSSVSMNKNSFGGDMRHVSSMHLPDGTKGSIGGKESYRTWMFGQVSTHLAAWVPTH